MELGKQCSHTHARKIIRKKVKKTKSKKKNATIKYPTDRNVSRHDTVAHKTVIRSFTKSKKMTRITKEPQRSRVSVGQ